MKKVILKKFLLGFVVVSSFLFLFEWYTLYLEKSIEYKTYSERLSLCASRHEIHDKFKEPCEEAEMKIAISPWLSSLKQTIENLVFFNIPMGIFSLGLKTLTALLEGLSLGAGVVIFALGLILYLNSTRNKSSQPLIYLPEHTWELFGNRDPLHNVLASNRKQKQV
jgi:hypothetical protein